MADTLNGIIHKNLSELSSIAKNQFSLIINLPQELPDRGSGRAQSRNRKALLILLLHRLSSTDRQGDNTSDYPILRSEVHILNFLTISVSFIRKAKEKGDLLGTYKISFLS